MSLHDGLEDRLIHANGRADNSRANIWNTGQLKQPLHRAVFAVGSMQYWKDHIQRSDRRKLSHLGLGKLEFHQFGRLRVRQKRRHARYLGSTGFQRGGDIPSYPAAALGNANHDDVVLLRV